jgi:chromosome segregation ATPase
MAIVDPVSQSKDMEKQVAKFEKFKKDFFDTLFVAYKKNGDAYRHCRAILSEGEKEIAKARKELADCIDRYNDVVKQTNTNRDLMRQIGKGLEEAGKRLDPIDKEIKDAAAEGEKMLKINKNHAALTSALAACAAARKEASRVSDKAVEYARECGAVPSYSPIAS